MRRRQASMLLVATMVATFALATFAQAASAANPIVTLLSGKCLEIAPNPNSRLYEPRTGTITAEDCIATRMQQQWSRFDAGTSTIAGRPGTFNVYQFQATMTGGCLTTRLRIDPGAPVSTAPCERTKNQLWTISRSGPNGSQELVNAASGLCLDVKAALPNPGARMIQYTCHPTPNPAQLFFI